MLVPVGPHEQIIISTKLTDVPKQLYNPQNLFSEIYAQIIISTNKLYITTFLLTFFQFQNKRFFTNTKRRIDLIVHNNSLPPSKRNPKLGNTVVSLHLIEESIQNSKLGNSFNTLRVRPAQRRRDYLYAPCKQLIFCKTRTS